MTLPANIGCGLAPRRAASAAAAADLTVLVVVHRPKLDEISAALRALAQARASGPGIRLVLWHNDKGPEQTPGLSEAVQAARDDGMDVVQTRGQGNIGFGPAINAALPAIATPFLLLLNQDAIPEPGALPALMASAQNDDADVAAWEMRQIPYEHPKDYDPVSGETGWCSAAALLLRTDALRAVGGFEPRFFMYCEDVDLSWRLRCAGWRLRYVPQSAVVHRTYAVPQEVKPMAVLQGAYAQLCLRARYAGRRHVLDGLRQFMRDLRAPEAFAGHRRGLLKALLKFAVNYAYFRRTRQAGPGFDPCFRDRDYELRREGAFIPYRAASERTDTRPTVTVIARVGHAPAELTQWLTCLRGQTLPPAEIILVGDGAPEWAHDCSARFHPIELKGLPAVQAPLEKVALVHARGPWCLLIDDVGVLPYADHLELLIDAVRKADAQAAAAWTWTIFRAPEARVEAHRRHAPRTVDAAPVQERPSRLVLRTALLTDPAHWRVTDVPKVTTVRYRPEAA